MKYSTELEPWGPHDVGGALAEDVDLSERDLAYWEWQIDSLARLALHKGLISDFAELRDGIEQLSAEDYERLSYYERWAKSLAYTLISRGVIDESELEEKVASIRSRQATDRSN